MKFPILTRDNFSLYAIKCYENPECTGSSELNKDLKMFSKVRKQLMSHYKGNNTNYLLLFNMIQTIFNLFGEYPGTRMLFFFCNPEYHSTLKTILEYRFKIILKELPEVNVKKIPHDKKIIETMEEL